MKPKLSIIVPIYNGSLFVRDLLRAIKALNFEDYEVVIINDGSTDDTYDTLLKETSGDHRYTILNQKNQGVSIARNEGIKHAQGDWVFFLDADDYISKDYFDFLNNDKVKSDIDMYSMIIINGIIDDYGLKKIKWPKVIISNSSDILSFATQNKVMKYVWGKLYKRTFITSHNFQFEKFKIAEDFLFNIKLCLAGMSIKTIDSGFYYYKQNSSSLTKSYNAENLLSRLAVIKRIDALLSEVNSKEQMVERLYMEFFLYQTLKHLNKVNGNDKKIIIQTIKENRTLLRISRILFLPLSMKGKVYFFFLLLRYGVWK
ncbi:glycosyltransferase [Enterobacter sichuanensis]|uniref:glycosyltransferase family 2 protein n=1 Tax=Enterobacter sichuanensis TaxID=2071710 RepID=UPI003751F514